MAKPSPTHPARNAVLVATDLGLTGAVAVTHADAWATRLGLPLVVVHVMGTGDALVPLLPHLSDALPHAEEQGRIGDAVRAHVREHAKHLGSAADIALEFGGPDEAIVRLASRLDPRLLVVGSSRKGAIEHALLGSTVERVVRHAPCPVLVARGPLEEGPVVVATDFTDEALTAERAGAEHAKAWHRELVAVHGLDVFQPLAGTFEPSTAFDARTVASLRTAAESLGRSCLERVGAGTDASVIVDVGDPARVVVDEATRRHASFVVVSSHGREGLARLTHGSAAERIVRAAPCPVLVTHLPAA